MKKVLIEGVGNNIFLALVAWEMAAPTVLSTIFLVGYLIVFGVVLTVLAYQSTGSVKGAFGQMLKGLQSHRETDEREKTVTQQATRDAYQSCIIVILCAAGIFGALRVLDGMGAWELMRVGAPDYYVTGILLLFACMVVIQSTFFISWCIRYRR